MRWAVPAVLVAVLLVWWGTADRSGDTRLQPVIQAELLQPYGEAVAAEDWEAARAWTTEAFRRNTSEVVFMSGQARNQDEWGPLDVFLTRTEPEEHREDGRRFYRVDVERVGALSNANAAFDVVREPDGWRIDRMWWVHPPSPATQRVF